MGEIITLGGVTRLDIPVDRILQNAKVQLKGVVIIGFDKSGETYAASSYADGGTVMWLLEMCKQKMMEAL